MRSDAKQRTYYDFREGKIKPVPNCEKVQLVWDESTCRCRKPDLLELVNMSEPSLLGFLRDGEDEYWPPADDCVDCEDWLGDSGGGGGLFDWLGGGDSGDGGDYTGGTWDFDNGTWTEDEATGIGTWYDNETGETTVYFAGGRVETDFPDGTYYYENPDGSWGWTDADGTDYWGDAQGNWQGHAPDGTTYNSQTTPSLPAGKSKADAAKKKAEQAANQARSGGGSGSGGSSGGGGSKQPTAQDLASATNQAACLAKGGRWNGTTCLPPSQPKKTLDQQLKEQVGFGAGALAVGLLALFLLPSLIRKL